MRFSGICEDVKNSNNYEENSRLMRYLGNVLAHEKKLSAEEAAFLAGFAVGEMEKLLAIIPQELSYKKKDEMFAYEDSLLMVYTLARKEGVEEDDFAIDVIKKLVTLVNSECTLENAVNKTFGLSVINKVDVESILKILEPITDVYRRGKFYQGLNNYKDNINNCTPDAKRVLADFTVKETEKLLQATSPDEDEITELELIADVCKYFIDDRLLDLLKRVMELKYNNVRFYALETLLDNKCCVSSEVVEELAKDLSYAELSYSLLVKHGKGELFPKEYSTPEYLAKSNLVHWLVYPTELNKMPDEIELLGEITVKKQPYFIFKYKSDSENLSEGLKNEWLIGWSNSDGDTFSDFDLLSDYLKKDTKKTLKYIAKKLLK